MNKRIIASLVLLLSVACAWSQGPNGTGTYYQSANGKKGQALKTAFFNIIKNPDVVSYDGLIKAYEKTDTRPDGYVRDWYSNTTKFRHGTDKAGSYKKEGDVYNREHSVPQSWFSKASPMVSDIVHVVPTDGYVNNRRSDYPFGENNGDIYKSNNAYSKLGRCTTTGYSGTVFEPNDEVKGDIARIYFYMVTCYEDRISGWTGNARASEVFDGNKYPGLKKWVLDMMMRWSKLDPIDAVEQARNEAVQKVQGNRNPFVDYPGLEEYIFGSKTDVTFSYDNYDGTGTVTVSEPVISPAGGTFYGQQEVSITCPTTGADIYFTFDALEDGYDSTPSAATQRYTSPLTITESGTLKAIAIKDGEQSSIVKAEFIISDEPLPQPSGDRYAKVTSSADLQAGDRYIIVYEESAGQGRVITSIANNRGLNTEVLINNSIIDASELNEKPLVMTLETVGGNWAFNFGGTYMALLSKANSLDTTTDASNAGAQWTISPSTSATDIVNVGYSDYSLRYNKGASIFRCYTGGQNPVTLYRLIPSTDIAANAFATISQEPLFDLQGRRLNRHAQKGVYIRGGKKFIQH